MKKAQEVTEEMLRLQRTEPTKWSVTLDQWNAIIDHAKTLPSYETLSRTKGSVEVNMYDLNTHFVIPWTMGLGVGLALLLNEEYKTSDLMLSHCWAEGVQECQTALNDFSRAHGLAGDTRVWFCLFANYQAYNTSKARGLEDAGPTIGEQLKLDPFGSVIAGVSRMVAIHTTTCDLYERLWCVYEVSEALKKEGMVVQAALSVEYRDALASRFRRARECGMDERKALTVAGLKVDTLRAKCANEDDEAMIWRKILEAPGDFDTLNDIVLWFRAGMMAKCGGDAVAKEVANAVLDIFGFDKVVVDRSGYDGMGVEADRAKIALEILDAPDPASGRVRFKVRMEEQAQLNGQLFDACYAKDFARVKDLIDEGADVWSISVKNPKTVLQVSAKWGSKEICELLVGYGLSPFEKNVMVSDGSNRTIESWDAIEYARSQGHTELADWLEQQPDPVKDKATGPTP